MHYNQSSSGALFSVRLVQAMSMVSIITGSSGTSEESVDTASRASTTLRESASATSPKMVWWPLSQGVGTEVMKNCEPFVP